MGVVWAGSAPAAPKGNAPPAPKVDPRQQEKLATQLNQRGERDQALAAAEEGLAVAPKDPPLLYLKATILFGMNDNLRTLDAYEAFLKVAIKDARWAEAKKIADNLKKTVTTFIDITVANGPADIIYVGLKTKRVDCRAEPSCKKSVSPGNYKVTVEREGFKPWTGRVSVESGVTAPVAVTLEELPSTLAVRVAQPGARITVDGAPHDPAAKLAPGPHKIEVSLDHHEPATLEAVAREGKPIALDVTLSRRISVRVQPLGAKLLLDGEPALPRDGAIAVRPGPHSLRISAGGFEDATLELPADPGPDYQIAVALRPIVVARPDPPFPRRRKLALVAGGLGLAAVGTGLVLGRQSQQLEADALALCPVPSKACPEAPEANDLNRRGRSRALQANVAFGVAGGAAIAAAVLWLTGAPESRVAVTPRLGGVAGLDVAVRF